MEDNPPILGLENEILEALKVSPAIVVVGEPGSGKSSQICRILDRGGYTRDNGIVAVTQPRRIATISAAKCVYTKENVDFHTEGEQGVEFEKLSVDDPFLNKLVADDPEDEIIDGMHKANKGIKYPAYDPEQPWNENKPVLGMRYESPQQLKHALANYGVANGFKLWYYRNDSDCLLIFCGRDLSIGRCASKKKLSNKDNLSRQGKGKGETQGNGKGEHQQKAKEKGKVDG
ncbi:splicing factor [Tanacetum coccineum]